MVYISCLSASHAAPVINWTALSPKRKEEGSFSNDPMTTITQTKALDRRELKMYKKEKKRGEQGPCMYSTMVGEGARVGGRRGGFKE